MLTCVIYRICFSDMWEPFWKTSKEKEEGCGWESCNMVLLIDSATKNQKWEKKMIILSMVCVVLYSQGWNQTTAMNGVSTFCQASWGTLVGKNYEMWTSQHSSQELRLLNWQPRLKYPFCSFQDLWPLTIILSESPLTYLLKGDDNSTWTNDCYEYLWAHI